MPASHILLLVAIPFLCAYVLLARSLREKMDADAPLRQGIRKLSDEGNSKARFARLMFMIGGGCLVSGSSHWVMGL